jgi:hypothetical protein
MNSNSVNDTRTRQERFAQGMEVLTRVDGEAGRRVVEVLADISPELGHQVAAWAFGEMYDRPALAPRDRQLVTLGVLTLAPYARAYRELRLPVVPDGKGRYGRLDVVIWMPGLPDVVVEIDSAPNAASAQKLAFARGAGAYLLWVRFGSGGIEKIDDVMVLDIRDAVRGVCEAGSGG